MQHGYRADALPEVPKHLNLPVTLQQRTRLQTAVAALADTVFTVVEYQSPPANAQAMLSRGENLPM